MTNVKYVYSDFNLLEERRKEAEAILIANQILFTTHIVVNDSLDFELTISVHGTKVPEGNNRTAGQ